MKRTVQALAAVLVGAGLLAAGATPAVCSDEFCAMSGTQIKAEVVKEKAIEWAKDRRKVIVANEDSDSWSVLALTKNEEDIAILIGEGAVFFGIAGKGDREVDARAAEKVFGKDLRKLREIVKKEMGELWKAGVVKVEGGDIQPLADATALGTLEKGRDWELTTKDCTGKEIEASELK